MSERYNSRLLALGGAFRASLAADRAAIVSLAAGPDQRDDLLVCIHRLAGVAGLFGAPALSDAAERVEETLRSGKQGALVAGLSELLREIDREVCELRRMPDQF